MSTSLVGQTVGHYRILDQLGAGGMGVVYRAQDLKLGRQVAIKVLSSGATGEDAIERFRREARTASSLNHPNICTIYGFDEHEGRCYLAMELLEGEPLDQRLSGQSIDLAGLLDVAIQVADALDSAHAEGILHRDIKPANIFITRRGQVKILDFGLAKLTPDARRGADDLFETRAQHFSSIVGTTVGTIAYMSPEQARGEELDQRTDLFSLGVVLYEMATGRQSFPGHTTAVVFDGILNREPAPASAVNASIPPELDRIIGKALEKDRALRYQSAADLRADLKRLRRDSGSRSVTEASGAGLATGALEPSGAPAKSPAHSIAASVRDLPDPPPVSSDTRTGAGARAPWALTGAATLIAVIAVGSGIYVMMRSDDQAPVPADTSLTLVEPASAVPAEPPVSGPADGGTGTPSPSASAPPGPASPPPRASSTPAPATGASPPKTPAASAPAAVPAEATQRLEVARAKLDGGLVDQGVEDLRQIVRDFPSSPIAADASFLMAESLERAGKTDDAMAAYIEFDQRFGTHPRAAESKLRRANLLLRNRNQQRQTEGYNLFGDIVRDFPSSPEARQALQARRQVEAQRRNLRGMDPVLKIEVPALLLTLRAIADQFPGEPETMLALNQLAAGYEDMDQYQAAAEVWEHMARQFPGNPVEVWFKLGELYERRLRNPEKAREAYARVPPESPRYRDAQQRLNRR